VDFRIDWAPLDGVAGEELAATWARLELWIGPYCISSVEDLDTGTPRRSIYGSMYPLAEWTAYNWWLLQRHIRPASYIRDAASHELVGGWTADQWPWMRHHNMRGVGDGFIWPNLTFLPEGDFTRVVWAADAEPVTGARIRYTTHGESLLRTAYLEAAFQDVVHSTITRLEEAGVQDTPLQREWEALLRTPDDERDFCVAAARLGLDPYDVPQPMSDAIIRVGREVDADLLSDYLDAVDLDRVDSGVDWLKRSAAIIHEMAQGGQVGTPLDLTQAASGPQSPAYLPWERGYDQAVSLREVLDIPVTESFPVEDFFAVRKHRFDGRGLQALGAPANGHKGALVLARSVPRGPARFTQGRALWHSIFESSRSQFLLTEARSDRNRTARAFAAELLAPAEGIATVIGSDPVLASQSDVEHAAQHYRVSPLVVQFQIRNQLAYV